MESVREDDELLERFADGDASAFVPFYRRHLAAVLGYFLRRTGDPELTADLTAEVFAAALLAAERYRPGDRPARAWLYAIAAHKLADSRRRGRVETEARRRLAMQPLSIDDEDIERIAELARADSPLESAIQSLPAEQREAVMARVVDERPYSEIAARHRVRPLRPVGSGRGRDPLLRRRRADPSNAGSASTLLRGDSLRCQT